LWWKESESTRGHVCSESNPQRHLVAWLENGQHVQYAEEERNSFVVEERTAVYSFFVVEEVELKTIVEEEVEKEVVATVSK
jgi:hypothetical protein